jgi:predicted O-methyltransferase YrrM
MHSRLTLLKKFLHYQLTASNGRGHGIHSPFVFEFVQKVLNDGREYYAYKSIEDLRRQLKQDQTEVEVDDKGAGSSVASSSRRRVSEIARTSLKPRKYAQLLFRMVNFYQPANILELGTSLGITTAYLASANPRARVVTIEGADAIADKAAISLANLGITNVQLVKGDFNHVLPHTLEELGSVDFAFVDGNHRKEPTLQYLEQLLPYCHPYTIIVFDDIYWSAGMEEAWAVIKDHPAITCTVDLFFVGLAFLRPEPREKQHFRVRF